MATEERETMIERPIQTKLTHYSGIDVMKFAMAICVIAIHTSPLDVIYGSWPPAVEYIISLAVPFFYISSGVLLAKKLSIYKEQSERRQIILQRAGQIGRIFIYWLMIYLPIAIADYYDKGFTLVEAVTDYCVSVLISGESPYAWPLWFLYSMTIVLAIWGCLYKVRKVEYILLSIFLIVLAFNEMFGTIIPRDSGGIVLKVLNMLTSRTICGGAYLMCGILLGRHSCRISWTSISALLLTGIILFLLEYPLYELLGGIAIFGLSMRINAVPHNLALSLRSQSMWIYYIHMYFIYTLLRILIYTHRAPENIYVVFAISSATTILTAILLTRLQKRPHFQWLKTLIS